MLIPYIDSVGQSTALIIKWERQRKSPSAPPLLFSYQAILCHYFRHLGNICSSKWPIYWPILAYHRHISISVYVVWYEPSFFFLLFSFAEYKKMFGVIYDSEIPNFIVLLHNNLIIWYMQDKTLFIPQRLSVYVYMYKERGTFFTYQMNETRRFLTLS